MKIALFVHCFYPDHFYGTETYTLELARHLQELGHEVVVVTAIFAGEPEAAELVSHYRFDDIAVVCLDKNRFPNTRVKDTYYQPAFGATLRQVLTAIAPDIVHVTHLINHTAELLEVAASAHLPVVATLTDFFGFCFNNKLETADSALCAGPNPERSNCLACYLKDARVSQIDRPLFKWLTDQGRVIPTARVLNLAVKLPPLNRGSIHQLVDDLKARPGILHRLYQHYAAMITPTKFLQDAYRANGFQGAMDNMWFGVDLDRSAKPPRDPHHVLQIGFIGQLAEHKGTDLLVEAFTTLPPGSAELVIYGPLDQSPPFIERLKQIGAGHAMRMMGTFKPTQMAEVLASLDVLVIPSRWYENSPLVLLNALASHTPVVVADVAGLTEFIQSGVNGFAFERGNARALALVLQRFVDGSVSASVMGQNTRFERTTRTMTEEVLKVYQRVLEAHRGRSIAGQEAAAANGLQRAELAR